MNMSETDSAWYIISAIKMVEIKMLLDHMSVEYYIPFTLRPVVYHRELQIAKNQLLSNYIFAKLDVNNQYYFLKHNDMFMNNVIDVLRVGNEFVQISGHEIETWKYLSCLFQIPVRFHKVGDRYYPADPEASSAEVIYFCRRKLKALLKVDINGVSRAFHVAAFNDDNIKPIGLEMKALYNELRKNQTPLFEPDMETRLAWMRSIVERIHIESSA